MTAIPTPPPAGAPDLPHLSDIEHPMQGASPDQPDLPHTPGSIWTRPLYYTDMLNGKQVCRDDLWAVTTQELTALTETHAALAPQSVSVPEAVAVLRSIIQDGYLSDSNTGLSHAVLDAVDARHAASLPQQGEGRIDSISDDMGFPDVLCEFLRNMATKPLGSASLSLTRYIDAWHSARLARTAAPSEINPNVFFDALADFKDTPQTSDDGDALLVKLNTSISPPAPSDMVLKPGVTMGSGWPAECFFNFECASGDCCNGCPYAGTPAAAPSNGDVWRAIDAAMPALAQYHCPAILALSKGDKEIFARAIIEASALAPSEGQAIPTDLSSAATDVLAERKRQQEVEGWMPEHDDKHLRGNLSRAAAVYALAGSSDGRIVGDADTPSVAERVWPWDWSWFKPNGRRRNLVKAGALILAEIERLDRLAKKGQL